jgi:hypothetical protein
VIGVELKLAMNRSLLTHHADGCHDRLSEVIIWTCFKRQAGSMASLTRRDLTMAGLAAGAGCLFGSRRLRAQPAIAGAPRIIDTHHHFYPPRYTQENLARIQGEIGRFPASAFLNWTPRIAIERMDQAGVATAICSITTPGVWFDDGEAARGRARDCNEFGAQMIGGTDAARCRAALRADRNPQRRAARGRRPLRLALAAWVAGRSRDRRGASIFKMIDVSRHRASHLIA